MDDHALHLRQLTLGHANLSNVQRQALRHKQEAVRKVIVRARAPLRISFGGGGTDVPPYPQRYGGLVLSATIDRYAYCSVQSAQRGYHFHSADLELEEIYTDLANLQYGGKLDLAKAVVKALAPQNPKKFSLSLFTEAPPGSGLGSSSSLMVAIIRGVSDFLDLKIPRYPLAELAYKLERVVLGIKGGYQDQYAATFGGFNFIEFGDKVTVNPLKLSQEILHELHANLLLVNTGEGRLSSNILSRQIASYEREDHAVMQSLSEIKRIGMEMKSALVRGDLGDFGHLISQEWEQKKQLDEKISTKTIEALYLGALRNGAQGGKVLGAGGGGHMMFVVPLSKRRDVNKFLVSRGYQEIHFGFDDEGAVSWRVDEQRVLA